MGASMTARAPSEPAGGRRPRRRLRHVVVDPQDRPDPGLGVFDTLLVRDGRPVDLDAHVDRLARSVLALYDVSVEADALAERIAADSHGLGTARVRTSYDPRSAEWEIEALRIDEPGPEPRRLVVRRVDGGLGSHKWSDRRLVSEPGDAHDVLPVDAAEVVLECGTANVFAVVDSGVVTPPLDGRILPGTVRARVLALLAAEGTPLAERRLSLAELAAATEVFGTSSVRGVHPVAGCRDVAEWPVGELTLRTRERLRAG